MLSPASPSGCPSPTAPTSAGSVSAPHTANSPLPNSPRSSSPAALSFTAAVLVPAGFTDTLLTELRSYRQDHDVCILCVPETEHLRLSKAELRAASRNCSPTLNSSASTATASPSTSAPRDLSATPIRPSRHGHASAHHRQVRCPSHPGRQAHRLPGHHPGPREKHRCHFVRPSRSTSPAASEAPPPRAGPRSATSRRLVGTR